MHATAGGKAILANIDEDQANELIDDCEFEQLTEHTISDREELLAEFETVREQGYALNDEEEVVGARTLATTITRPDGSILGVICLSGPVSRFEGEYLREMVPLLKETANHIEVNIQRT
jgi:DNA-binding IclR family transcriptional regulator